MIEKLEAAAELDGVSAVLAKGVTATAGRPEVRGLLSGTPIGHPLHPALVALPLGMWSAALVADLSGEPGAARRLTAAGLAGTAPAMATGLSDWLDTTGAEQRVGLVHMGVNLLAGSLVAAGWLARRGGRTLKGQVLGAAGLAVAGAGGWLGGHLAYALGVGVDTNAFDGGPTEWTAVDLADPDEEGSPVRSGSAGGVSLAVVDSGVGGAGVSVLANRCSHRGGPLAEGEVDDGCLRCPWHGSEFDVTTGAVRRGPATVAQPVYEVRGGGSGLEVRREEPRSLRTNSVRPGA